MERKLKAKSAIINPGVKYNYRVKLKRPDGWGSEVVPIKASSSIEAKRKVLKRKQYKEYKYEKTFKDHIQSSSKITFRGM